VGRAIELARRGLGNTSPNPPVGAVLVGGGRTVGEGFHHACGEPHAEVEALRSAGGEARGATAYVSLEPCDHHGRTPPCTEALIGAGIARVVIGALDPNPRTNGGGARRLREAGIAVEVLDGEAARRLVEPFAVAIASDRPYLTLKMAVSLDGKIGPERGQYRLTGAAAREYVRELRSAHDAVMVGAGTVRVDDPLLTLRPHRSRRVPFARVVVCESGPVPAQARVLRAPDGHADAYRRTILLAPAGLRAEFSSLERIAEVVYAGGDGARQLDLGAALVALRGCGITSVLCEGGPTLAARLLECGLVDRLEWLVAPSLLQNAGAVPALGDGDVRRYAEGFRFDRVERLGDDVLLSLRLRD
jgi:diaminohydroxyphosphoribosylaminopyrimidine deaminase/5-amino-6-(5-phosphoribosylamino)uracil reductase